MAELLSFLDARTLSDAQTIRVIRNECREFMTRNTSFLTEEDQEAWFNSLDFDTFKPILLCLSENDGPSIPVGYGYVKIDNGKAYLTGGLIATHRNRGYGKKLFLRLLEMAKPFNVPIVLEVLKSNSLAFNLYKNIGFQHVSETEKVITMEYKE